MDDLKKLNDTLLEKVSLYIHNEDDLLLINKAIDYAYKKHDGQFRKDGSPYIIHPLSVAIILSEINAGPNTIIAGLLHDVIEDTETSLDEIKQEFNLDVSEMVEGLTKIEKIKFQSFDIAQINNHQKILLAMAKDIRVILVKLADRLHNIRTLDVMQYEKQVRISKETLDIYVPIANRLGMYKIKAELEDKALKYIDPYSYHLISNYVKNRKSQRNSLVEEMIESITNLFSEYHFNNFKIKGRVKNIYSIYKKMTKYNKQLDDIYDIFAIRVIVDKVETCYQALGIIHAHYVPIPKRFKDYIAVPKPNMYQSLHTTIVGDGGEIFEVQIRTLEMDQIAENGVAAHWAYKEGLNYSKEKEQYEIAHKLKWYGELLELTKDEDTLKDAEEFVGTIKGDILDQTIYVFTPKGEIIDLPKGSTPIDFAYRIHTDLGNKTTGAIINNKIVPLTYELVNGDVVSIKTNKNSFGPSEDWLKIVKTQNAKHKIRAFINKQNKETLILTGKTELEKELKQNKIEDFCFTTEFLENNFGKNNISDIDDLYFEIGKNTISVKTIINKILGTKVNVNDILEKQIERSNRILTSNSQTGVIIEGLTNPQLRLGNCCNPIPGDKIIGFVSKGTGIVVHRADCKNLENIDKFRLLKAEWATNINRKFPVKILITAKHRDNTLNELMTQINLHDVQIAQVSAKTNNNFEDIIKFKLLISDKNKLDVLIVNIKKIKDIYKIIRE